jgi:hypothetical protein
MVNYHLIEGILLTCHFTQNGLNEKIFIFTLLSYNYNRF